MANGRSIGNSQIALETDFRPCRARSFSSASFSAIDAEEGGAGQYLPGAYSSHL
jgi:hypothetical protein